MPHDPPATGRRSPLSARFVLAVNAALCTVVALLLWLLVPVMGQYGLFNVFVHSQLIGGTISSLILLARRLLRRMGHDSRPLRALLILVLIPVGYLIGTSLAHWLLGLPGNPLSRFGDDGMVTSSLITSILVAGGATWFFLTREEVVRLRLAAAEESRRAEAEQRRATEAQLAMLRAQIDPHMLFNTLANLRALIGRDSDAAREMLDRLVHFMRATLAGSRGTQWPLRDELETVENYLALMQVRMGARLGFALQCPDALRSLSVPTLLLQPLVENSIRHGIEPSMEPARIDIEVSRTDTRLRLCVTDTGVGLATGADPGCDTAAGAATDDRADAPHPGSGFGLAGLRERLAALYGDAARLQLSNVANGRGTVVTVDLPLPAVGAPVDAPSPDRNRLSR
ncbi:MAG: histidine kinase [Burkholderiaceae bacterium]